MIPVNIPLVTEEDTNAVVRAMQDGWISGDGPIVQSFESLVAEQVNRKHAVAVSNGSDALELAFQVMDLRPGDEVILPSFTIISCLAPLLRMGLVPVFVDVDRDTWNLNPDLLEGVVTDKTKALLVVHTYGLPADMDPILSFANKYSLRVVEDAAEAQGLTYKGKQCGSFGDLSTFSFYANKNVTTGEGGMVLADDRELASSLRYYRNLTFFEDRRFVHEDLGWNMRLSSLQAALGISQTQRIEQSVARRKVIAGKYREALDGIPGLRFQPAVRNNDENCYWVFGVLLENHPQFASATDAMLALKEAGVATRPFFFPLHKQPVLSGRDFRAPGEFPVSEKLGSQGFYLPNGLGMSDEMLTEAVAISASVLGGSRR